MDFEKICMMFTMQEPYYGIILSSMQRIPCDSRIVDTIAVNRSGNVFRLYYNPQFIDPLPVDTVMQLLKHETLHIAFNHFSIFDTIPDSDAEIQIRNIAKDLEINCYLDRSKVDKSAGGMWAEDFGFSKYQGTREYYRQLKDLQQQSQQTAQAACPVQDCNGGLGGTSSQQSPQSNSNSTDSSQSPGQQGQPASGNTSGQGSGSSSAQNNAQAQNSLPESIAGKGKPFDDHSLWPKCDTEEEANMLNDVINELLVFAAEEVEKSHGTIPGEIAGKIDRVRNKPKPVADWKRYFRRYLGNEFTELIRKSKKRESRRFPDAAGNRHQRKSHILVAIDTSGSVSMPEYREFFGQIKTLQARASFHVLECDTRIVHEYDFKNKPNEILHGGGGTDFYPPIEYFNNNRKKYDALVYFTDGYSDIPKETPKETLWVISSGGDHDRKKYRVNGASVVFIKK